jgi:hypothetical protein
MAGPADQTPHGNMKPGMEFMNPRDSVHRGCFK